MNKDHLQLKIDLPKGFELPDWIDSTSFNKVVYDSNIFYSKNTPEDFTLQILFRPNDPLEYLIESQGEHNFLEIFKPASNEEYTVLDFSKSKILHIEKDRGNWENGMRYFVITIDECIRTGNSNILIPPSSFALTEGGLGIIDELYEYQGFYYDSPNKLEAIEKNPVEVVFGGYKVEFKVNFEIFSLERKNEWNVCRCSNVNLLPICSEEVKSVEDIQTIAKAIMLLLSFYQNQTIDYTYAQIKYQDKFVEFLKSKKKYGYLEAPYSRFKNLEVSIYELINSCNSTFVLLHFAFIEKIIQRFIYSGNLEGESKFMILYNILEQIRNFVIKKSQDEAEGVIVRDEYKFTLSNTKVDKFIKDKIKDIAKIVSIADKEEFERDANKKVSFIRKITMNNQFIQFFKYTETQLDDYGLDFEKLLGIRNTFFHGHDLKSQRISLDDENEKLGRLVFDLIRGLLENRYTAAKLR